MFFVVFVSLDHSLDHCINAHRILRLLECHSSCFLIWAEIPLGSSRHVSTRLDTFAFRDERVEPWRAKWNLGFYSHIISVTLLGFKATKNICNILTTRSSIYAYWTTNDVRPQLRLCVSASLFAGGRRCPLYSQLTTRSLPLNATVKIQPYTSASSPFNPFSLYSLGLSSHTEWRRKSGMSVSFFIVRHKIKC